MRRLLLLTMLALTACGPSAEQVSTAIAQTQAAQPTATLPPTATTEPTATPIPLADLDLSDALIQDNDLPVGFSEGQISTDIGDAYKSMPPAARFISEDVARDQKFAGRVMVWLYESPNDAKTAFQTLSKLEIAYASQTLDLGDEAVSSEPGKDDIANATALGMENLLPSSVVAHHCAAVMSLVLFTESARGVIAFAERLDKRIKPLVCSGG